MKIGFLIDRLNVGGVEKSALQEVIACKKLGIEAKLLVLSRKSIVEGAHEDLLEGLSVEYLDDRLPKLLKFTFTIPGFAFFSLFHLTYPVLLPFVIKKKELDYIISHGSYTTLSALGLKLLKGIPYSIYFWDPVDYIIGRVYVGKFPDIVLRIYRILGRMLDRFLVNYSDYIFVAGTTHNNYLERFFDSEKIVVVNPGTPLGTPTKNKEPHVLMVTTWKEGKHPDYVFDLVKEYPEIHIKMVGRWLDTKMEKAFLAKRSELGYEKNIELIGEANEAELADLYPKAAVQLTTNLEKGFGMPVLEAAACGTVSIVPVGSGVCSVFEHKVDGFFSKERDTKEIVGYIKEVVKNPDKAVEMGLKSYNKVKSGYTWESHTQKIVNKILEYLTNKKS